MQARLIPSSTMQTTFLVAVQDLTTAVHKTQGYVESLNSSVPKAGSVPFKKRSITFQSGTHPLQKMELASQLGPVPSPQYISNKLANKTKPECAFMYS